MVNDFLPHDGPQKHTPHETPKNPYTPQQRPGHDYEWASPTANTFKSPTKVADEEEQDNETNTAAPLLGHDGKKPKKSRKSLKEWLHTRTKKQWIIIAAIAVVLLGAIGTGIYFLFIKSDAKPVASVQKKQPVKEAPKPTTVPSTLSGLPVVPEINNRPVTAVMIENSTDARPQSGLNQASVVFEAVAEGGITRFLTLFQDNQPEYVGPVRSVRPYYIQWLMGFDAGVAHVGGSGDALAKLKEWKVVDLDQFANSGPYWRVSNRYAPHNMYTSIVKLQELQAKKGQGKGDFSGFARKTEAPSASVTARTIDFNISSPVFNAHYDYDAPSNSYKRSEGGAAHMDEKSNTQLAPKVVVGLVMPQGKNGIYTTYQTIGSGAAYIFQDGIVVQGTWNKASNEGQFTFKDANGKELKLNPGQTWLSVVGGTDRVSYKP